MRLLLLKRLLFLPIASTAIVAMAAINTTSAQNVKPSPPAAVVPSPSSPSEAELEAGRQSRNANNWAVGWILGSAVITAWLTWWAVDKSGKASDLTLARYQLDIAGLNAANLTLRGQVATLETNASEATKKVAGLQKAASDAIAAQQRVEIELSKQKEETDRQREQTANAQRSLLELQRKIADRHLTAEQKTAIQSALRKSLGEMSLTVAGGSPEALNFATELVDVIRGAGWKVNFSERSVITFIGVTPQGLGIRLSRTDIPQTVATLQNAFKDAGMLVPAIVVDGIPAGSIDLLVGVK